MISALNSGFIDVNDFTLTGAATKRMPAFTPTMGAIVRAPCVAILAAISVRSLFKRGGSMRDEDWVCTTRTTASDYDALCAES